MGNSNLHSHYPSEWEEITIKSYNLALIYLLGGAIYV